MTVSVIIPWRGGCPHREAARDWADARWRACGIDPVIGEAPAGPWRKARAVAEALPRATGDVLVVADADVWCDGVDEAVHAVRGGARWAIPHGQVHRLTSEATDHVLKDTARLSPGLPLVQRPYTGFAGGGMVALPRETYERVPLDARFAGWGQEDEAWALALTCLAGEPWRGRAPLWHLWHPPQDRATRRWGSASGRALWRRYHRARFDPDTMKEVLAGG